MVESVFFFCCLIKYLRFWIRWEGPKMVVLWWHCVILFHYVGFLRHIGSWISLVFKGESCKTLGSIWSGLNPSSKVGHIYGSLRASKGFLLHIKRRAISWIGCHVCVFVLPSQRWTLAHSEYRLSLMHFLRNQKTSAVCFTAKIMERHNTWTDIFQCRIFMDTHQNW